MGSFFELLTERRMARQVGSFDRRRAGRNGFVFSNLLKRWRMARQVGSFGERRQGGMGSFFRIR